MKETISGGKTIELAVERGARELGLAVSEVQFEVISDAKKGFLGLGETMAQVRVFVPSKDAPSSKPAATPVKESSKSASKPMKKTDKQTKAAPSQTMPDGAGLEFVQSVVNNMGIDVVVDCQDDGRDKNITISGADAGVLIGYHGETLTALQYLANLAANKREEDEERQYSRVTVDIEGYRAKREATLVELAKRTAGKVKRTGRYVYLDAMPANERRIIHATIQDIPGVSTYSKGDDHRRYVVVCLERKD